MGNFEVTSKQNQAIVLSGVGRTLFSRSLVAVADAALEGIHLSAQLLVSLLQKCQVWSAAKYLCFVRTAVMTSFSPQCEII